MILGRVVGGSIFRLETLSNLSTGNEDASDVLVLDRTKKINFRANIIFDNGINPVVPLDSIAPVRPRTKLREVKTNLFFVD